MPTGLLLFEAAQSEKRNSIRGLQKLDEQLPNSKEFNYAQSLYVT
jgi:hypothetical protein